MNKAFMERWLSNYKDLRRPEGAPTDRRLFNLASGDTTQVFLYDMIGLGWDGGISADEFAREVRAIGTPNIELHINSPGGDVYDGLAMLNTLRQHKAKVTTVVDGLAASAASFIAMAGDEVLMAPNSQLMIHDAMGVTIGNAEDHEYMVGFLDKQSDNIADIYAAKAGGTRDDWRAAMRAETWYGASEAIDAGLADGLVANDAEDASASAYGHRSVLALIGRNQPAEDSKTPDFDWDPELIRRAFEEVRA